jgi:hypothetical protein
METLTRETPTETVMTLEDWLRQATLYGLPHPETALRLTYAARAYYEAREELAAYENAEEGEAATPEQLWEAEQVVDAALELIMSLAGEQSTPRFSDRLWPYLEEQSALTGCLRVLAITGRSHLSDALGVIRDTFEERDALAREADLLRADVERLRAQLTAALPGDAGHVEGGVERLGRTCDEVQSLLAWALPGDAGHVERLAAGREVEREPEERRARAEETR